MSKQKWAAVIVSSVLALVMVAWGILGAFSVRANGSYTSVLGTYTLKGNVALYGEDGKRLRDGFGKIIPCKTGTLVIQTQVVDVITGTLTLANVETPFAVEGWVGAAGKTSTLTMWGDSATEPTSTVIMVLRARIQVTREGAVKALGHIKFQGLNDDVVDKYIFEGRMVSREFVPPE